MENKTCNTCEWFVEETETIGDYQHSEAVRLGQGFCLIQDLFYEVMAKTKACNEYQEESK